jgi:hypothetical protein
VTDTLAKIPGDDRKPMVGDVWTAFGSDVVIRSETGWPREDIAEHPDEWTLVGRVVPADHPGIEALRTMTAAVAHWIEADDGTFADRQRARERLHGSFDAVALASLLAVITGEAS